MGSAPAAIIVAARRQAARIRQLQRCSMAVVVRRLRHQWRVKSCRDSASVSRLAAAAIYAGPAGHAVVSEQADYPQIDANGVTSRGAPAEENGGSGEPGFRAGTRHRITPAGAVAGSVALREHE